MFYIFLIFNSNYVQKNKGSCYLEFLKVLPYTPFMLQEKPGELVLCNQSISSKLKKIKINNLLSGFLKGKLFHYVYIKYINPIFNCRWLWF